MQDNKEYSILLNKLQTDEFINSIYILSNYGPEIYVHANPTLISLFVMHSSTVTFSELKYSIPFNPDSTNSTPTKIKRTKTSKTKIVESQPLPNDEIKEEIQTNFLISSTIFKQFIKSIEHDISIFTNSDVENNNEKKEPYNCMIIINNTRIKLNLIKLCGIWPQECIYTLKGTLCDNERIVTQNMEQFYAWKTTIKNVRNLLKVYDSPQWRISIPKKGKLFITGVSNDENQLFILKHYDKDTYIHKLKLTNQIIFPVKFIKLFLDNLHFDGNIEIRFSFDAPIEISYTNHFIAYIAPILDE